MSNSRRSTPSTSRRTLRYGLLSAAAIMASAPFASAGITSTTGIYDVHTTTDGVDPATVQQTDAIDVGFTTSTGAESMTVNSTGTAGTNPGFDTTVTNLVTGTAIIGNGTSSAGSSVTIDGGGTAGGATWTINNGTVGHPGNLTVGQNNGSTTNSTLTIQNGGQVSDALSIVGLTSQTGGAAGTVNVGASGDTVAATWTMSGALEIGYINNSNETAGSPSTTGTVNISNGALVTVNGTATINSQASIAVALGSLGNHSTASVGNLNITSGGVLNVTGVGGTVAAVVETGISSKNVAYGTISVTGAGSLLEITTTVSGSGLVLGAYDTTDPTVISTLTIQNGGAVSVPNLAIGKGGGGTVTVGGGTTPTGTATLSASSLAVNQGASGTGGGTSILNIDSTGLVNITGDVSLNTPTDGSGSATINLQGGTLNLNGHNVVLSNTQGQTFSFTSGTLKGVGTFGVTNAMDLNQQGGTLIAGQGGAAATMNLSSTYELASAATLQLDLAGTGTAGTNYDLYAVTGAANLSTGGILNIVLDASFTPTIGDTFNVLTGSSVTAGILALEQNGSATSAWSYSTTNVANTLQLTYNGSAVPEPASLALLGLGALGLLARRRRHA